MRAHLPLILFVSAITLFLYSCDRFIPQKPTETPVEKISPEDSLKRLVDSIFNETKLAASYHIRLILESRVAGERYRIQGTELYSSVLLPRFYTGLLFQPFWIQIADSLPLVKSMIHFIRQSEYHGLVPEQYHLLEIQELAGNIQAEQFAFADAARMAELDLLLTDAFFMLASHLYHGKLDAESLESQWGIQRNKPELQLDNKLSSFTGNDIETLFRKLYPPHPGYESMVAEARMLSRIVTPHQKINFEIGTNALKPGESSVILPAIRKNLASWGVFFTDSISKNSIYDSITIAAVKDLQHRFGYNMDGIIGKNTLAAINLSPQERLKQLYVNMERLRWLPEVLENRYVLVNIAGYSLHLLEGSDTLLSMKTIVGKDYRETPVFNARITYLVFSPTWTVPPGILRNDVIPAVRKNVQYLAEKNMQVLDSRGQVIDPTTINWKTSGMRYTIRQAPGPQNALGRVKFMFPNKHNVYLHDTPSRELFARDERSFSSGCIRIEKPFELAKALLSEQPEWTEERIRQAMNGKSERTVVLKNPPGVYLFYLTAWADVLGVTNYRTDIYNRDRVVFEALQQRKHGRLVSGLVS